MERERPHGFRLPLYLRPAPPRTALVPVAVVHAGALSGLFAAALPVMLQWGFACLVLILFGGSVRRIYARAAARVVLNSRDDWFLIGPDGHSRALTPVTGLVLHAGLILLHFRDAGGRWWPFLFSDRNTDAATLRRLRVRLRYPLGEAPRGRRSRRA